MNTKITAPLLCDLSAVLEGRYLSRLCIGSKRDVLVLSTEPERVGPYFRLKEAASFRLHHWHSGQLREAQLPVSEETFDLVTHVGENYLCIAAERPNEKQNAHVFTSEGHLIRTWDAGHSINQLQANSSDEIWVSYLDTGIFTCEKDAPSQQGLNCFDQYGRRSFGFLNDIAKDPSNDLNMICDCYALNVTSNRDTWLCY